MITCTGFKEKKEGRKDKKTACINTILRNSAANITHEPKPW